MPRVSRALWLGFACLLAVGGCTKLHGNTRSVWPMGAIIDEGISYEVYWVDFPLGDPEANGALWDQVDEQKLSVDVRQRLDANGFRVGIAGSQLSPTLEHLLKVGVQSPPEPSDTLGTVIQPATTPTVRRATMNRHAGEPPTQILTLGDKEPLATLTVLTRDDEGQVFGRSFQKAQGMLMTSVEPESDGRVRFELVPEIDHGDPRQNFVSGDNGQLTIKYSPPSEVYDRLRWQATLSLGEILVIGARHDRPGSLGFHYFTEGISGSVHQKLLLIRLIHAPAASLLNEKYSELEGEGKMRDEG